MLSTEQFDRVRRLALGLAGIELVERHRELLERRSRRLVHAGGAGLDLLLAAAEKGDSTAVQSLLRLVTTKFTGFFRHPSHFEIAAQHALEAARQRGRARLWSAGAATGEEPYSLGMKLIEAFQSDEPPVSILATDVDVAALEAARGGQYRRTSLNGVDPARRRRFFDDHPDSRHWNIVPAVRHLVEFRELNLANAAWSIQGPFDVIFCRNVLMYLEASHRYSALERFASLLAPDGLLLLDPAEHLGQAAHLFTASKDAVYFPRQINPTRSAFHLTRPKRARNLKIDL
jgi:chemotaxis protein methyltransferase CheR